jgi:hypothetical protein
MSASDPKQRRFDKNEILWQNHEISLSYGNEEAVPFERDAKSGGAWVDIAKGNDGR